MIPLFAEQLGELQKLKGLDEWKLQYDKFEHLCKDCLDKCTARKCALCSVPFNLFNNCRESMVKNLHEHKKDASTFADKKYLCQNCFARNAFYLCARCKISSLGPQSCREKYFGNERLRKWLLPYLPESKRDQDYGVLCPACYDQLQAIANVVADRYKNWLGGTKGDYLRGYRILKTLGRIEEHGRMDDPDAVAKNLRLYAAQKGGNGYIQFFWERHQERHAEEYVAGYGPKGNPYYRTTYHTDVWYTGYATAVLAERPSQAKTNKANDGARASNRPKAEDEYARVLGLKGKVTREEIRQKYRDLAKQYHPDRVADLGPELNRRLPRRR